MPALPSFFMTPVPPWLSSSSAFLPELPEPFEPTETALMLLLEDQNSLPPAISSNKGV
jgi:hypothetical protein